MARFDSPRRRAERDQRANQDEFYETLATPAARPYRSDAVAIESSTAERAVRLVSGILMSLLGLRFLIGLFTTDTANALVAVIFNATSWLAAPFESLFGSPPSGGGGYFDLPALAAIAMVAVIAWAINLIIRESRRRVE